MTKTVLLEMNTFSKNSPRSYALVATLAAMWADIFLMFENGG